jgi:hypothetical protein
MNLGDRVEVEVLAVVGSGLELSVFCRFILGIRGDHLGSRFQAEHVKGDAGSEATGDSMLVVGAGLIASDYI